MIREHLRKFKVGDRYGRLVILDAYVSKKNKKWAHKVLCDCGNEKIVIGTSLSSGETKSCGCYQIEVSTTHGMSRSPEYAAWSAMLTRVGNHNQPGYSNYGGRGIGVCDRWRSFDAFFFDMGKKPSDQHSLDRIDNNNSYSPDNCRWATGSEQSINQRLRSDNKTGVRGVYYRSDSKKYYASIQRDKKRLHIGSFESIGEAEMAVSAELSKLGELE